MKFNSIASAVLSLIAVSCVAAQTVQPAGKVLVVAGTASIDRAGKQLPLIAGSAVETGDTLFVGDKSTLQVRFSDESIVALRANSQFKIENYKFDNNAETDRFEMGLVKGGLRTITGLIGKANNKNYLVQTSTATIGIRGTHFSVVACNNDCTRVDGTAEANGTYGNVTDGRITVSNASGLTEFGQQDSFYVATVNSSPTRLLTPPAVLADRGRATRGQAPATNGGEADSFAIRSSGTNESTSAQLPVQRSLISGPNSSQAGLASDSSMVMALLATPQATPPIGLPTLPPVSPPKDSDDGSDNGRLAAVVTLSCCGSTTNQLADRFAFSSPALIDPDLANIVVTDAASTATAIGRFHTVSRSADAKAYWYYAPPAAPFELGTHRAFGDAPVQSRPTSGIAQYNHVGGTTPTDNFGRPGVFSATNYLTMNFSSQTIQTQGATTFTFTPNAAMNVTTRYTIPAQTFSMNGGLQTLTGVTCAPCAGTTSGSVNGQFLGNNSQGFAASILVRNTQLTTTNTANAGGNVSVYAKQ